MYVIDTKKLREKNQSIPQQEVIKSQRKRASEEKWIKNVQNSQKIINKMALVSSQLPIITLNRNGLNSPIKRQSG